MRNSGRRSGFTLAELLVAMFVLAMAVAGALAVIQAAGKAATGAREKLVADGLCRTALADALYAADDIRQAQGGALNFATYPYRQETYPYARGNYRMSGAATDFTYGWLWRAHSFDAANGLYSLDVWAFRNPNEPSVLWGAAPDTDLKRRETLLFIRSKLEARP